MWLIYSSYIFMALAAMLARFDLRLPIVKGLRAWHLALGASLFTAVFTQAVSLLGAVAVLALFTLASAINRFSYSVLNWLLVIAVAIFALALGLHLVPGFIPISLFNDRVFGQTGSLVSLNLNYDKSIVGLILLGVLAKPATPVLPRMAYVYTLAGIAGLALLGRLLGLQCDPKFDADIGLFLLCNLFFTCVAEESFFRLLVQDGVYRLAKNNKHAGVLSVLVTALLFLAVHFSPKASVEAMLIVGAGSVFYAFMYQRFQSITLSIFVHFLANATHVLLLTYPFPMK